MPVCDEDNFNEPGCYGIKQNKVTDDIYNISFSIMRLQRIELILLVIIIIDLIVKMYNDRMVK